MAGFLADVTVVVHFAALLYIGLGGFLAWKWPKSIYVHVFFAAWGVAINTLPITCPLTAIEDHFRRQQGLDPLPDGFNEYYIFGELIPHSFVPVVAIGAGVLLVGSYVGFFIRRRNRKLTASSTK